MAGVCGVQSADLPPPMHLTIRTTKLLLKELNFNSQIVMDFEILNKMRLLLQFF